LMKNVFRFTETESEEMKKQMTKEIESGEVDPDQFEDDDNN
jgi:hypothetical protein